MDDLVDTEALQSFLAVAEEFSFRRAAERLHIDQSALSRRIQKLEAQIGFELLSRSTREVRLTNAGRAFYDDNLHTLARLRETVAKARRVAQGRTGHLRIGYMAFAAINVMPRTVRAFRTAHPDISIQITYLRTQGQKLALARGEIDVGFMIGPFNHPDFSTLKVSDERLMAVLPSTHALLARRRLLLSDLAACQVILGDLQEWEFYRSVVDELFSTRGLIVPPALEASSTLGILGLVAAGLGVSIYPECLRRFRPNHIAMRNIDDRDQRIETILTWRGERAGPPVAAFAECCRRLFVA